MKISITGINSAEVFLDENDLEKFAVNYDIFDNDRVTAQLFVSNIVAFLTELQLIELDGDSVLCSIIEKSNGMIVRIEAEKAAKKDKSVTLSTEIMYVFDSTNSLTDFCCRINNELLTKIQSCTLYTFEKKYIIIMEIAYAKSTIYSKQALRGGIYDKCRINKTREYGKFLSHTPIETISLLRK